jgi:hypothetical protein
MATIYQKAADGQIITGIESLGKIFKGNLLKDRDEVGRGIHRKDFAWKNFMGKGGEL